MGLRAGQIVEGCNRLLILSELYGKKKNWEDPGFPLMDQDVLKRILHMDGQLLALVELPRDGFVAMGQAWLGQTWPDYTLCFGNITTHPNWRRRGFGQMVM
jgi:ribosomal protein S18 acetylase RimI-like enzyme